MISHLDPLSRNVNHPSLPPWIESSNPSLISLLDLGPSQIPSSISRQLVNLKRTEKIIVRRRTATKRDHLDHKLLEELRRKRSLQHTKSLTISLMPYLARRPRWAGTRRGEGISIPSERLVDTGQTSMWITEEVEVDEVVSEEGVGSDLVEDMGSKVKMVEGTVDEVEDEGAMMGTTTAVEVEVVDEDLVGREVSEAVDLIGVSHLPRPPSTRWRDNEGKVNDQEGNSINIVLWRQD
jgi:hypothetical protein